MIKIPDTWSDRVPRNMNPKRQAQCFHRAFHQGLTEHGFFCVSSEIPEEKKPSAQSLMDVCRYYRLVDRDLLQIVDGSLDQVALALHENGVFSRYVGMGGHIGINVYSLYEQFTEGFPPFGYGFGIFQQRLMHFQFPGMEKSFCNSFLNLFRDDFSYAMELEQEFFFDETLPWLDRMTTPEKHAQWRMDTFLEFSRKDWGSKNALWSQLKLRRWKDAETCIRIYLDALRENCIRIELMSQKIKEQVAFMESILHAIAQEDTQWIDQILEENRKKNVAVLSCVSKGIDWKKIVCPYYR